MAIPRKRVLKNIAGLRGAIGYHLDEHIPQHIAAAGKDCIEYWRKEVSRLIDAMEFWARRLSNPDAHLDEASKLRKTLEEMLDRRLRDLDD